jgi:hypothetical protein
VEKLPNFLVVGCQKGATTSLHHYLNQHPGIFLPSEKETKFFVMNDRYKKGIENYRLNFSCAKSGMLVGEVDPDYMYFEDALPRIDMHLNTKQMKIIFILRNPIERAFSHYLMSYRRGLEDENFYDAINLEAARVKMTFASKMHFSYVDRGFYLKQILRFEKYFNKSQFHFILTDDLRNNREKTMKECFNFLGIDSDFVGYDKNKSYHKAEIPRSKKLLKFIIQDKDSLIKKLVRLIIRNDRVRSIVRAKLIKLNQRNSNVKIDSISREKLKKIYKIPNLKLQEYISRDLSHWD